MPINPYTLFQSLWIILGMWMVSKYFKMCCYEFLFIGGGEKYLNGELWHTKQEKKEMSITAIITKRIQNNMKSIKNK